MPYRPTSNYKESLALNAIPDATPTSDGVMSASDKAKLNTLTPPTPTGVVADSYNVTSLTVDTYGRITAATNGIGIWTVTVQQTGSSYSPAIGELVQCAPAEPQTIQLPYASASVGMIVLKNVSGEFSSFVTPQSGETIDSSSGAVSLNSLASLTIVSDGVSNWMVL